MTSKTTAAPRYEIVITDEDANPNDPPVREYVISEDYPGSATPSAPPTRASTPSSSALGSPIPRSCPPNPAASERARLRAARAAPCARA